MRASSKTDDQQDEARGGPTERNYPPKDITIKTSKIKKIKIKIEKQREQRQKYRTEYPEMMGHLQKV